MGREGGIVRLKDLIDRLSGIKGNPHVMLSVDSEGNSFHLLEDVELSGQDIDGQPCHPDDVDPELSKVVVLWP